METKYKIALASTLFVGGLAVGHFTLPAKVVEKEKIVTQDKIVEKIVHDVVIQKKDNKVYHRTETTHADGSKTVDTTIVDKDQTNSSSSTKDDVDAISTKTDDKSKTTTYSQQSLILSLQAQDSFKLPTAPVFGLMVQKRMIGPFYVGIFAYTNESYGANLGIAF